MIAATLLSDSRWRWVRAVAVATGFVVIGLVYLFVLVLPPMLPAALDPIARQVAGWDTSSLPRSIALDKRLAANL